MIDVTLEQYELAMAWQVGSRRQFNAVVNNRKPRMKEQQEGQLHQNHGRAACAELAVAKYLNVYWGGHVGVFTSMPDVAFFEVRWSMMPTLKVKENDDGIVIGVTGQPPYLKIAGYIDAKDARRKEWERDYNNEGKPAYFVPHDQLRSAEELRG